MKVPNEPPKELLKEPTYGPKRKKAPLANGPLQKPADMKSGTRQLDPESSKDPSDKWKKKLFTFIAVASTCGLFFLNIALQMEDEVMVFLSF